MIAAVEARGLVFDAPPIVAFGANSAKPHYEPHPGRERRCGAGSGAARSVGRPKPEYGFRRPDLDRLRRSRLPEPVERVWRIVRQARDAAVDAVRRAAVERRPIAGFEADRAARDVVESAGFGPRVRPPHRPLDRSRPARLGAHLDDYETHDERLLIPGVGFSVEPGIYLPGEFGIRSEVNVYWGEQGPEVTPREPQEEPIVAGS